MNLKNAVRRQFRVKIFAAFLILNIVVSIAFMAIFIQSQKKSLEDALIKEGLSLVKLLAYNSRLGVHTENADFLKDPIDGIMQREGVVSISVFSLEGKAIEIRGDGGAIASDFKTISEKIRSTSSQYYFEGSNHFEFWAPVISTEKNTVETMFFGEESAHLKSTVIGFVRLDFNKKSLTKSIHALFYRGFLIAFIFLSIGAVVVFLLVKKLTKSFKNLTNKVQAMGQEGHLSQIQIETEDEVGELATAFNKMADSLKEREAEKQKLLEQLGQSQRLEAIGTLAGGIAHDFNNLLTIIQSNMELAKSKAPEYVQTYIEKTLGASKRGSDLVNRLLHFSLETPIDAKSLNIGFIAKETINLLKNTVDQRINIAIDAEADLWKAKGDAGQVQQIIINLCANARDAIMETIENQTDKDKSHAINLTLRNVQVAEHAKADPQNISGDYVLLSVRDTGCGMDKQTLSRIFEPFFTTKKPGKGTGLGLSAVYGIVRHHGGWIDVKSEVGQGTLIDIYFPKFVGKGEDIKPSEITSEVAGGTETILLVDDEEEIVDALKEKLEDLGYKVFTANDGESALKILKARRKRFDLIVLDQVMPVMTGIEVMKNIKEMKLKSQVLIYSGQDLRQYDSLLEGVNIISKPHSLDALAEKIREILGYEWKYPLKTQISRVKLHYIGEKTAPYEEQINGSVTIYKLFKHLANEPRETFLAVYLDSQLRIIAYDPLSTGTTDKAAVYPKEVVRTALLTNASSVILVHNHPSGNIKPSHLDIVITAAIQQACEVMEIKVHDHIIISGNEYYSFLESGLMK